MRNLFGSFVAYLSAVVITVGSLERISAVETNRTLMRNQPVRILAQDYVLTLSSKGSNIVVACQFGHSRVVMPAVTPTDVGGCDDRQRKSAHIFPTCRRHRAATVQFHFLERP
jgi:hypothetical protein